MIGNICTGSSGFLGKHLIKRLPNVATVGHQFIDQFKFDAKRIFFLSAYGNMSTHTDENKIVQANVLDLIHVLKSIDWKTKPTIVFISTSSVKLKHQTFYSRTKKMAEELLLAYMEKYDSQILIIRPMSITGVGEQEEHLIPKLIDSCLNGTEMPFVGEPVHDFIDVEDFVDGVMCLVESGASGIFEIGTGVGISNEEVKDLVELTIGKDANIKRVKSMRKYDSKDWVSKNMKIREFGWRPEKSLYLSIKEMYELRLRQDK